MIALSDAPHFAPPVQLEACLQMRIQVATSSAHERGVPRPSRVRVISALHVTRDEDECCLRGKWHLARAALICTERGQQRLDVSLGRIVAPERPTVGDIESLPSEDAVQNLLCTHRRSRGRRLSRFSPRIIETAAVRTRLQSFAIRSASDSKAVPETGLAEENTWLIMKPVAIDGVNASIPGSSREVGTTLLLIASPIRRNCACRMGEVICRPHEAGRECGMLANLRDRAYDASSRSCASQRLIDVSSRSMLHGVVRRKFELTEDQLTSTVLAYLDLLPSAVLSRWLARSTSIGDRAPMLAFSPSIRFDRFPWPRTSRHGEPDVLVLARDEREHAIVIEAKYGAPKSQWSSSLDEEEQDRRRCYDQLARYGQALREGDFADVSANRVARASHAVVYLTADAAPPLEELRESLQHAQDLPLYWLSWHALAQELEDVEAVDETQARAAAALRSLLVALGFEIFSSFALRTKQSVADCVWDFDRRFFAPDPDTIVKADAMWRFADGDEP